MPVWSLRLRNVSPPWTLWRATHPQSWTLFPTSFEDNSPQNAVLLTHSRGSLRGKGGLALEVSVSEAQAEGGGCVEAEAEYTVLVLESDNGMVLETLHRNTKHGLVRKAIKGKALRNKDMVFLRKWKLDNGYPVTKYPLKKTWIFKTQTKEIRTL